MVTLPSEVFMVYEFKDGSFYAPARNLIAMAATLPEAAAFIPRDHGTIYALRLPGLLPAALWLDHKSRPMQLVAQWDEEDHAWRYPNVPGNVQEPEVITAALSSAAGVSNGDRKPEKSW